MIGEIHGHSLNWDLTRVKWWWGVGRKSMCTARWPKRVVSKMEEGSDSRVLLSSLKIWLARMEVSNEWK